MQILLSILVVLFILIAPVLGVVAYFNLRKLREEVGILRGRVHQLSQMGVTLSTDLNKDEPASEPVSEPESDGDISVAAPAVSSAPVIRAAASVPPVIKPHPPAKSGPLETHLMTKGMVYLGAITIALSGVYLVKYSVEQGYLGPIMRIALGLLFGVLLVACGEIIRRREIRLERDYGRIPAALASAGVAVVFAAIYGAHALYSLLTAPVAFVGLAVTAAAAVGLSLYHGRLIAALGLLGAFMVPILVGNENASMWLLYSYLLVIVVGALAVHRRQGWVWLGISALGGAAVWGLGGALFLSDETALPVALYLSAVPTIFLGLAFFDPGFHRHPDEALWPGSDNRRLAIVALAVFWCISLIGVSMGGHATFAVISILILTALGMAAAWREAKFNVLALGSGAFAVMAMLGFEMPGGIFGVFEWAMAQKELASFGAELILVPEGLVFPLMTIALAVVMGITGYLAVLRGHAPITWASLGASAPPLLLMAAYLRLKVMDFTYPLGPAWTWAGLAMLLSLILALALWSLLKREAEDRFAPTAYVTATVVTMALVMTTVMEGAWFSVGLAMMIPALALAEDKLDLPLLRRVALVGAVGIGVRLIFNPYMVDYPIGGALELIWPLYGYGLPAIAFAIASWMFRRRAVDTLVTVLEAGVLIFIMLLVTLEIRLWTQGSIATSGLDLFEASLHSSLWLSLAYGIARRKFDQDHPVLYWGWRILAVLGGAQVVLFQVLVYNPMVTGDSVGELFIFNDLLLAYGVPALLASLFALYFRKLCWLQAAAVTAIGCLGLTLMLVSLEVRQLFHGGVLASGIFELDVISDAEWYSYSAAWLSLAIAAMAVGIWRANVPLRYAALAVLALTVLKVFLSDMGSLEGLLRVASLMGLGFSLIGVGFVYQKYVRAEEPVPP